jgi:O-antigen/teichoic acid export membrane protein
MSATAPAASVDLRGSVLRGVAWKGASRLFLELSKLVVAVVLARLLAPRDYGVAGMVLVFAGIVPIFSGLALGAALVQRHELTEADRSTAFWTGIGLGVVFGGVGVALAGPIARFYGQPEVRPLFMALSASFVLTALGMTHGQLLVRELDYRRLELRTMAGTLCGAVTGISAAALGYGPWAIISQLLAATAAASAMLWLFSPWHPHLTYSLASLKRLAGFGGNVSGALVLSELNQNTDNLLIGRFLGAAALGTYGVAYNVMLVPFSRLTSPLQEVLYAAFSRVQGDTQRVLSVWLRVNRLVVEAPDLVHVVLGDRWRGAVPVVRVLAWVGLLQSLQGLNASVLQARDRTGWLFRFSVGSFAVNLGAFVLGLQWGIVGVAVCFAVSSTLVQPVYALLAARSVGSTLGVFLRNLAGVAQAAGLMLAVALVTHRALAGIAPAPRLVLVALAGAAVYLPALAWREPRVVAELWELLRRRSGRGAVEHAHDSRGNADGDGVVGHVLEHDRVRADDGAAADPDAGIDDHVLAQPRAVPDLDRLRLGDPLREHRPGRIGEGVVVVGDVDVTRHQHVAPDADGRGGRENGAAGDARAVADDEGVAFSLERLEPAASADVHTAADDDAPLSADANGRLQDAARTEGGE